MKLSSKSILSTFTLLFAVVAAGAQGLYGRWKGELKLAPNQELPIVLEIENENGEDTATMDSPKQGAFGIPVNIDFLSADSISVSATNLGLTYSGHLSGEYIEGTLSQMGLKLPLILKREEKKLNRPQTPQAPFPYATEEVTVANDAGGCTLSGTLTVPEKADAHTPVVIMVSGSGLQDRDETLFEHKPFAVIADRFARAGIASLRYDDRGYGKSTGEGTQAVTPDFASDAAAVVEWIRKSGRFGKTGILGHSEGGEIAYMLAATKNAPDFIISIAGPTLRGDSIIAYQNRNALLQAGIDEAIADRFGEAMLRTFEYRRSNPGKEIDGSIIASLYPESVSNPIEGQLAQSLKKVVDSDSKWMNWFVDNSPAKALQNMKCPALLIFGEKDRQVPPSLCLEPARSLAPDAKVMLFPGLNHLMQTAPTGVISEYGQIEETFSPDVIDQIVAFIKSN